MIAGSFPESPALNRGIIRAHWRQVVARLPLHLPPPISQQACPSGPLLIVRLRGGSQITYDCKLPPSIRAVRDYMVALVVRLSKTKGTSSCVAALPCPIPAE